ncbi:MAG: NUDIX hydrolase [Bryobacterales bacterium]|nr:NUDIX hydrolase [Bryobacterales bacterium]
MEPADAASNRDSRRYPARPVVGVGAIVIRGGEVLLIRRGRAPLLGYWSLPGGAVETGERLEDALCREVLEETGLQVQPLFLAAVFERIMPDSHGRAEFHYVLLDYVCELLPSPTGQPQVGHAGDDASALGWFALDEAETLQMTPGTYDVIARALVAFDCCRATTHQACAGTFLRLQQGRAVSHPDSAGDPSSADPLSSSGDRA